MDIRKAFTDSFHYLKSHPSLVVPILLMLLVPTFLGYIYLHTSGLYEPVKTLAYDQQMFEQLSYEEQLAYAERGNYTPMPANSFFAKSINKREIRDTGLMIYMEEQNHSFLELLSPFFNFKNLVFFIIAVSFMVLISHYFYCSSNSFIVNSLRKKKSSLCFAATFKQFLGYCWLVILGGFFVFALPALAVFIIILLASLLSAIPFIFILIPLAILAAILTVIYLLLRFYFAIYILFYEHLSAWSSMKKSYSITKGNLKKTFLLGLITFALIVSLSFLLPSPYEGMFQLFFAINIWQALLGFFLAFISTVLFIFIYTFCSLFNFQAYRLLIDKQRRKR